MEPAHAIDACLRAHLGEARNAARVSRHRCGRGDGAHQESRPS